MLSPLVECVPNFSEGRDARVIDRIARAVRAVPGTLLLDRTMDADHNRSVLTFAGPPMAVLSAAFAAVEQAVRNIDLTRHQGVHPRIGAADVVPFVPVEAVTLAECAELARTLAGQVWERLRVPVYLYEAAARAPERTNLAWHRRGGFEALLREMATDPTRAPDVGQPVCHPTAGTSVIGARRFLIAYNINLNTEDLALARRIARLIRFSSGGFPHVKAIGLPLASRGLVQISMNLTDFERTPLTEVFETVRLEAARAGVTPAGSEIIGLIPLRAVEMAPAWFRSAENFSEDLVLENRIAATRALQLG
jgi:glutamate formiminotransferase